MDTNRDDDRSIRCFQLSCSQRGESPSPPPGANRKIDLTTSAPRSGARPQGLAIWRRNWGFDVLTKLKKARAILRLAYSSAPLLTAICR